MNRNDDAAFYRNREMQEMRSSELAADPHICRLHWEMAQRYGFLARQAEALAQN
ncbi:hypothetical protein [Sphingobium phenoxybenzoativorans]|uniref:hypothetical protein n=1 Tax=Sphingobium phenoxybenzoativorans TaxID=1592790 RepID=UPI00149588EE|nr:hypothetical protein [Sphingobium phenoxybenzoativorans]